MRFATQGAFFDPAREFAINSEPGLDPHQLLLLAIERALAPPVVHMRSTLQPMRVIVVGPNAFQGDVSYESGPEPRVLLPHVLGSSPHPEPRFHQRIIQGEILSDENGKLYEKLGTRIREVHQLASSSNGELIELVPAGSPRLRLIGPAVEPKPVEPHENAVDTSARSGRRAAQDEVSQKGFIPLSSSPEKSALPTHRKLFADPGQWRVVFWGEFKEILSAQLANPERLRDSYRLPCYVQVFETQRAVAIEELAAAYALENKQQTPLYFLTSELAEKLELVSLLPLLPPQPANEQRAPRSLLPHERMFRLLVANDPTVDVGSGKSKSKISEAPAAPSVEKKESEPATTQAVRHTIPDRFIKDWEFRISRDEALYDMSSKPTLVGLVLRLFRRLRIIKRRNEFRKWQALLAGKQADEQLWEVRPPAELLAHPFVSEWVTRTLTLGGYDTPRMASEWEIFWRRKG